MSPTPIGLVAGTALILVLVFKIVRQLYGHSLSNIPGPSLWAISRIPYVYYLLTGRLVHKIAALHDAYGGVVRVAPNEVSFSTADSWNTIYSHKPRAGAFPKNPVWHPTSSGRTNSISTANPADHARIRRALARGFDANAFIRQDTIIHDTADRLIQKLRERTQQAPRHPINMTHWLNSCTYDMIGLMGFSEDVFQCLERGAFPASLLDLFKGATRISQRIALHFMPFLRYVTILRHPIASLQPQTPNNHVVHIESCIEKRMSQLSDEKKTTSIPDFVAALQQGVDEGEISETEMNKTAHVLFGGGGGTTAATLSGIISYLLRHPARHQELAEEVRASFDSPEAMSTTNLESLEYLHGVIQEGLRLCPPFPCGVARAVPREGATVSGYELPGGTNVCVQHFAAHRNPDTWADANNFVPERWLKSAKDPSSQYYRDDRSAMHAFSLGPRRCIAERQAYAEMRLILARIVYDFDMEAACSPNGLPMPHWEEEKTWPLWDKVPLYVTLTTRA